MNQFIKIGDVLINLHNLSWCGIINNNQVFSICFRFKNPTNDFFLTYADFSTATNELNRIEQIIRVACSQPQFR